MAPTATPSPSSSTRHVFGCRDLTGQIVWSPQQAGFEAAIGRPLRDRMGSSAYMLTKALPAMADHLGQHREFLCKRVDGSDLEIAPRLVVSLGRNGS